MTKTTGKIALVEAEQRMLLAQKYRERTKSLDTPDIIRTRAKQEFERAEKEYRRLQFLFVDHAPSHQMRLAAINAANREFWSQR